MKKLALLLLTLIILQDTAFAGKEYARRYPTDTAMEVYTPNNPAPGVPGGSDTQVQFNDGGSFGGDAGLTYNKTTDTLVGGVLAATTYSYAFNDDLSKYIRMDADASYGYLNANTDMVISANTGGNIIALNTVAQTDVVSSGTTPETGWIVQTATGSIDTGPMSMIHQELGKDYTSSLANNGIFLNMTGDENTGVHINQAAGSTGSGGLIQGVHEDGVGQFIDLDGDQAYFQRLYQNVTGSTTIFQWNLNENYPTTDYLGTGTLSGTTFTGNVIDLNNSQTDVFRLRYDGRVHIGSGAGFIPTDDTKYINSQTVTSIGSSFSPLDIFKLVDEVDATFAPTVNTNSGLGITLYAASGGRGLLSGTANFNGGLPITANQIPVSALAGFNVISDERTSGTLDAAAGVIYQATHGGYGATDSTMIGGFFDAGTEDSAGTGTPTGSLDTAIGGYFTSGGSGVDITNAISLRAFEPIAFDAGGGAGTPTITNQTAALIDGTFSVTTSNVATGTDLTNMAVTTSSIRMTGSTSSSIHGIHADTFAKNIKLSNVSTANVVVKHQSTTDGTAANRIIVPTANDFTIAPNNSAELAYDTTQSRWLVTSPVYEYGVYTPTLSNIANVDSSTAFECQYMRVGNTVTVSGMITIDPTTISTLTQVNMTLPVTSNFATLQDVGGTGSNGAYAARILADTTNDRAQVYYIATDTGSQDWQFSYTYQVI